MQKFALLLLALLSVLFVTGCNAGGSVDTTAVQQQADKEKAINEKALKENPPPPGDGPAN